MIVAIAFTVVTWNAPMLLKYLVIVTSSFVSCVALYQWLIRPFRTPRFLFGMTPRVPGVPVKGGRGCTSKAYPPKRVSHDSIKPRSWRTRSRTTSP